LKKSSTALWRSDTVWETVSAQLPEIGESWNVRGTFLAQFLKIRENWYVWETVSPQLLETRKSWNIQWMFLAHVEIHSS